MSQPIKVIKTVAITDAILTATDVAESAYPAYSSAATYALDARVYLASTHTVYQSLQAGNNDKNPITEPTWWVKVEPTNRWKLFDLSSSTATEIGASAYYEFTPVQAVNSVGLINFTGLSSIRIRLTDPVYGVVYDTTTDISLSLSESTWYAWFFGARTETNQFVATDLPSYPSAVLRIDLTTGGSATIGVISFGNQIQIGIGVMKGVRLRIQDYSRKERNDFGDTELIQRAYSKLVSISTVIENKNVDNSYANLSNLRSTPCIWLLSDLYASLTVFGFFANFEIGINYSTYSDCTIDIESLT